MVRSLAIGVLVIVLACGGSSSDPVEPPRPVVVSTPPADAALADAAAQWQRGQPIRCVTVDDCMLVPMGYLECPGVCGFCGGVELAPRGRAANKCPAPHRDVPTASGMPPPQAPNCAACTPQPAVRAACEANVCVTKPA